MAQHIFEVLRGHLAAYGYWAVAITLLLENAGLPVPGETILLLASFLAFSERSLHLPTIILVATCAAVIGDNIGYWIGHHGGRPLMQRYQHVLRHTAIARGERLFARYGPMTIFFARFIAGLRIIAGPLAGALGMDWPKFALWNFLGAIVWVSVISSIGYFVGSNWEMLVRVVKHLHLTAVIVAAAVILLLWWRHRRTSG
ncbi:MAG TPA: DedA family protein [Terriglobales bacterium]|nr:DedA family protein [Terriglobales bacterium]